MYQFSTTGSCSELWGKLREFHCQPIVGPHVSMNNHSHSYLYPCCPNNPRKTGVPGETPCRIFPRLVFSRNPNKTFSTVDTLTLFPSRSVNIICTVSHSMMLHGVNGELKCTIYQSEGKSSGVPF